ncbi:MAG: transposase [Rhodobacteraceae bacterium]|nr:transposase [Paracoccaceae bacterium]
MSKGMRFTDEFKRDAVVQVVERGYAVSEVAERLGTPLAGGPTRAFNRSAFSSAARFTGSFAKCA